MHAILIADDAASWFESGPVQDVLISGNTFEGCGYNLSKENYVIAIAPENHQLIKGYMVHRNIRITGNDFKIYDHPVLTAKSTGNLSFTRNRISWMKDYLPATTQGAAFRLTGCEKVQIRENQWEVPFQPTVLLMQMAAKEAKTDLPVEVK